MIMENSYRYEAAILGDDLAALFAGYILKRNRIHFVFLDANELESQVQEQLQIQEGKNTFPYQITDEGRRLTGDIYQHLAAQVGIENPDTDAETKRLEIFLKSELDAELLDKKKIENIVFDNGCVLMECGGETLDADVLIHRDDVLAAGVCAQAVMEEKERRLEQYMKRLRIRQGKRTHRKMVYVTHSKSWYYAKEIVMQFAIEQGVAAVNPFMNYGFYMNGSVEKDEVVECCHQLIRTADELWVFGPISEAILTDIAVAVMEGKEVHFFSISENRSEIHELKMEDIIFEREVHAGQIRKSDLLNFVRSTAPRNMDYVQMSLFD